ncbi:heavy metal translocating P-type ATPase [Candidatus Kirkpatrickella diaphorinae]|uniref:Heavy metal translocating P-type ATPase n=1 Tax=Candidatus Kirkpatrickella diaphorinae TaxID=2984322 RepID=A0ABY6GM48_9PROT|nr:heavy metal translocating P-type ATPase [Candidatus Kirkpatrickella diaphorinae]UYH51985.1 heavy metal translocating P-type ATPase [Candidatus Kirkpatrickella diaphorinae]
MSDNLTLRISGMSCANCAARLERVLNRQDGVAARVDYASERAAITLNGPITLPDIFTAIRKAGFDAVDERAVGQDARPARRSLGLDRDMILLTLCAGFFFCTMLVMWGGWHLSFLSWPELVIASIVQFYLARHFYQRAFASLKGGDANMDVLVVLSTSCAYLFSVWNMFRGDKADLYFETGVFIIFFVSLGKWLEARSKAQAAADLETLLAFEPALIHVETPEGVMDRPIESLQVGDIFIIRPGENIAVDGEVISGESEVDEAILTGEAHPVYRQAGDKVFAGTTNINGVLKLRATCIGADTVVARMVETVRNAQLTKAPISRWVDRVTRVFVPTIIVVAIATFTLWFLHTHIFLTSLTAAIAVMVIACPCALGLATPIVLMVAGGRAARSGILMRNAAAFETVSKSDTIIFDKTGTLTRGQFEVTDVIPATGASEHDLLTTLSAVENHAEHPLARAIVNYARSHAIDEVEVTQFRIMPGRGVAAQIGDDAVMAGAPAYFISEGYALPETVIQPLENQGKTIVVAARRGQILGVIALEDTPRRDAKSVIDRLRHENITPVLLTGDHAASARHIATQLGIANIHAGILPDGKARLVRSLREDGHFVAMVGDGVNDAPALASADTSIAMGSAAALSMNHADIILIRNDLSAISDLMQLSGAALRKIKTNLVLAFLYNLCAIPVAVMGLLTPAVASAAMALSSLSVVMNALALRRWQPGKN